MYRSFPNYAGSEHQVVVKPVFARSLSYKTVFMVDETEFESGVYSFLRQFSFTPETARHLKRVFEKKDLLMTGTFCPAKH